MTVPADLVAALHAVRVAARAERPAVFGEEGQTFPRRAMLAAIVADLAAALYPRRLGGYAGDGTGEDGFVAERLAQGLGALETEIARELHYWQIETQAAFEDDRPQLIARFFAQTLPQVRRLIDSDLAAAFLGDPAARSVDEILVCYPGAVAILHHRLAHELHNLGATITARIISDLANERTGIDIHPGATIGRSFFIDHGTGVVIGETAIIGERVRLYQHVTLGARTPLGTARPSVIERHARHPIVGDDVVIYAGATILGRVRIGSGATIGGNVWLLSDVAENAVVVQPEARALPRSSGLAMREALASAAADAGKAGSA